MEQNPITPADSLVSIQDLPRQQNYTGSENVSSTDMTPITIKTSHLSREFKDILNLLDKRNRREGTCMLLKQCIQKQVIPKSFTSAITEKKHEEKLKHLGSITFEETETSQSQSQKESSDNEDESTLQENVADNETNNESLDNADNDSIEDI